MTTSEALSLLADRQAIGDTLYRYASCLDAFDSVGLRGIFTDDASFSSVPALGPNAAKAPADRTPAAALTGADDIVEFIAGMTKSVLWQHHQLTVYEVAIDGHRAKALTYLISHKTFVTSPDEVTVVVARYRDTLRREEGTWLIAEKVMDVGWMEKRTASQSAMIGVYAERSDGALAREEDK
jgi:3-phenylpropionate/cinnamic acid dioxygenase small subunit